VIAPTSPLHMGALHPIEVLLTLVLAFGPFVVLAVVALRRRRPDTRSPVRGAEEPGAGETRA
jgi:hypothetical protein